MTMSFIRSQNDFKSNLTPPRVQKAPFSADRFIANRSTTDFDYAHHVLTRQNRGKVDDSICSPSKLKYQKAMAENLSGKPQDARILRFTGKAPSNARGLEGNLKAVYTQIHSPKSHKSNRVIPHVPERVLDAPEIVDDFYLNLIDWGKSNQMGVALGGAVYIWDAVSGTTSQLPIPDQQMDEDVVTSLAWDEYGQHLAVGKGSAVVELWNIEKMKRVRVMRSQNARVQCMAWNSHLLASGSGSGSIHQHDVRLPEHHVASLEGHDQGVCGLQWSPDKSYLASGGNDNAVYIWKSDSNSQKPHLAFKQSMAAVKGLAWCPWQSSLLATGGGTADRRIRLYNVNSGQMIHEVATKSQISGMLWSEDYRELLTSHGYPRNQLTIWKYPGLNRVSELEGHTGRTLGISMSPDGTRVVSLGADETIRIWNCFGRGSKPKKVKTAPIDRLQKMTLIR